MYFVIAAVALAAIAKVAGATPLSSDAITPTVKGTPQVGESFTDLAAHALDGPVVAHPNVTFTTSSTGLHALSADAVFPATLQLCSGTGCSGCFNFDLSVLQRNVCLIDGSSLINSVKIVQPSNEGLPFGVYVGPSGCSAFTQIPAVNTCYNAVNGPFTDFKLTD